MENIEIIIRGKDEKEIASLEIVVKQDYSLKEYISTIKSTLKKTKRSLLEVAIKNEMKQLEQKKIGESDNEK